MEKPQEKYDKIFVKAGYSDRVKYYYDSIAETMTELQIEDLECLVDGVYKAGYLDGFQEALFFSERD